MPTLTRPTLVLTPAFDANNEHVFTFTVYGESAQIVANTLTIRNQTTNEVVYQEKQETFRYEHTVNAQELTNNVYYNATITTHDASGNSSPESIPIQFWCYTTPTIEFSNMPDNNVIPNASFAFQFLYEQVEGERLNAYVVNLYNSTQNLISTSGENFVTDGTPPYNGSYLFAGFEDSTTYYIEIVATTVEQTSVTTGLIEITVRYVQPDIFTLMELVNNCAGGYITVRSNMILIEGESNPDPPTYINNEEVDLREEGSWVNWDDGYSISGDFLTRIWFRDPTPYTELLRFSNADGQTISLRYMEGYENIEADDMKAYMEIWVYSATDLPYYIYSNYIDILPDSEYYNIWMTRKDNLYKLQLLPVTTTTDEGGN